MSIRTLKRMLSLYLGESHLDEKQKPIFSGCDASVHDHSQGTIIIGNNNSLHHGPSFMQNTYGTLDDLIQNLTRSHNAEYDMNIANAARSPCTPDTRTVVLQELIDWCNSDTTMLYWLSGMAGTGKTTIAYTVCQTLAKSNQLGASFFCSRSLPDCRDVKLIIPTIAFQLARQFGPFSEALASALRSDEYILKRDLDVQLRKLIIDPWIANKERLPLHTVIVLEALDECDGGHSELLKVIFDHVTTFPCKVLITSRLEPTIRDIMVKKAQVLGTLLIFALHEVEGDVVRKDIGKYLTSQLSPRVGPGDIQFLTNLAGTLFIFAATLVRFLIAKKVNTITRIQLLRTSLPSDTKLKMLSLLDELYKGVLGAAFHADLMELEVCQMREILLTVMCAREPLTRRVIGSLWNLTEEEVEERLDALRSVVSVPDDEDQPITVFHASFQDFMEDPARSERFCCHPHYSNFELVQRCLSLIKHELRHNICEVEGRPPNDSVHLAVIQQRISPGLQYASVRWPEHWVLSHRSDRQMAPDPILEFFKSSALYWFECLSLTGRLAMSIENLEILQVTLDENANLTNCTYDYLRFVQQAYDLIKHSAMETYGAALVWVPLQSPLRTHHAPLYEQAPQVLCGLPLIWTGPDQTISTHSDSVTSIAISRDGRSIFSGSNDKTVRVWNVRSRAEENIFSGHTAWVNSIAISADGSRTVSGSQDGTVLVRDIAAREAVFTLKSDSAVKVVAMSPNGKWIASGCSDGLVYIWDATDGQLSHSLQGHTCSVHSVSFMPDSTRLVSGSGDHTARIWDVMSKRECVLHGHTDYVLSVACSPNGDKIATGSCDKAARLWDTSGKVLHILYGHLQWVNCVLFMPDGKRVVTGSSDSTLRIWDVVSGDMIRVLTGLAEAVRSVAVFPDGLKIVSCSGSAISIWSLRSGGTGDTITGGEKNHIISVPNVKTERMAFSANGRKVLLSPSLRILDTITLEEKVVLCSDGVGYSSTALSTLGDIAAASEGSWLKPPCVIKVWGLAGSLGGADIVGSHSVLQGHTDRISSVSFSHNERQIVSASNDHTARIWDIATGKQIHTLEHQRWVFSATFSHDDTRIASTADRTCHVWNAQTGELLHQLRTDASSIIFSPDDRHITTSHESNVSIYDSKTYKLEYVYKGYEYWTTIKDGSSYALSRDGQWLCYFPHFGDEPRRLIWIPSQYRLRPSIDELKLQVSGSLFTPTSDGIQVCLPRYDGLITLVIPNNT